MKNFKKILIILITSLFALTIISSAYANGPSINLPTEPVFMHITWPVSKCYYNVTLRDVPSGYHVSKGEYLGWCIDRDHYISRNEVYNAIMYSSYDQNNPYYQQYPYYENWTKINYILNNKDKWDDFKATADDVQYAIWYFIPGWDNEIRGELAQPKKAEARARILDIISDADANGANFIPGPGQIMAVVLWVNNGNTQTSIIEVYVPFQNVVPEYPFGTILGVVTFVGAFGIFKYRRKLPKIFTSKRF